MTIFNLADILTGVIEAVILFKMYEAFCEKNKKFSPWLYVISIIIVAVMINISNAFFNYGIINVAVMVISFLFPLFLFNGKLSIKIIVPFITILLLGLVEIMVLFGITLAFKITVSNVVNTPQYRLLGIIVSKMLALFIVNIVYIKFRKKNFYTGTSYWLLFLLMFTTSTIAIFLIFKLSFNVNKTYLHNLAILCSFGLLFSTFSALYLYEHLAEQAETIRNQEQYEQHLKTQLKHLDEILITQKQIKKFKHDYKNFLIGLQAYFDNNDITGASNYMKKLGEKKIGNSSVIETGNIALDAILSTKIAIAESKKITVNTKIQIPEDMPIDPTDICVIFGNALDNAIEACGRMDTTNKRIDITIICRDKAILCKIVNTAPKCKKCTFGTSKSDKQNHGFGLGNIKTALSKYNAEPTIERTDTEFILKFVIFTKE